MSFIKVRDLLRSDVIFGAVTGAIGLIVLASIPLVAQLDPETSRAIENVSPWSWWGMGAIVVVQSLLVTQSRTRVAQSLIGISALVIGAALLEPGALYGFAHVALLAGSFRAARWREPDQGWAPWVIAGLFVTGSSTAQAIWVLDSDAAAVLAAAVQGAFVVALPAVLGTASATRRSLAVAREAQARAVVSEQEARLDARLSAERTAVARELHDIAAHHLSGIALMASAIDLQIDHDPTAAKESLAQVRQQSKSLLEDLRRLVDLLRSDSGANTALETLDGVSALVENAAAHGLAVTLTVTRDEQQGDLGSGVGPLSQFAAYRTVQEALANARRHSEGASCEVLIHENPHALVITVTNAPTTVTPSAHVTGGYGLIGMQERADLTGGQLHYGPTPEGGWQVRLDIPSEHPGNAATGRQANITAPTVGQGDVAP